MDKAGRDAARYLCRYSKETPAGKLSAATQPLQKRMALSGLIEGIRDSTGETRVRKLYEFARAVRDSGETLASDKVSSFRFIGFIVDQIRKTDSPEEVHAAFAATTSWLGSGVELSRVEASLVALKALEHLPPLGSEHAGVKAHGIHIVNSIVGIRPEVMEGPMYGHVIGYIHSQHPLVAQHSLELAATHVLLGRQISGNMVAKISDLGKTHADEHVRATATALIDLIPPDRIS